MDVERNPGPTEDENDTKVKAYIDHRTPYSRSILITLRKKAAKPTSETIEALKSNFTFKYRGNRAGRHQNKKAKEMENIQVIIGHRRVNTKKTNANFEDNHRSELDYNALMNSNKKIHRNLITITTTSISTEKKVLSSLPTFLVTNPCHITNKLDELRVVIDINAISVAILTESWLKENTPISAVALNNFATFRLDRRSPGGGVLVYVNHKIRAKRLPEF